MKSKKKSKKIYIILLVVCLLVMAGLVAGLFGYAHYMGTKTMGSRIKIFGEDVSGRSVEETAGMLADDFKKVSVTFQENGETDYQTTLGDLGYSINEKQLKQDLETLRDKRWKEGGFFPEEMEVAVFSDDKQTREENIRQVTAKLEEAFADNEEWLAVLGEAVYQYQKKTVRKMILKDHKRPDGRAITQIRPLAAETDIVPRVHGSAMFTRGQTQICTITTLAPLSEGQRLDGLDEFEVGKRYMHHYNFPSYSVGETKPSRGPGRREIGHGALAEKALVPVLPSEEEFPYAIRTVSETFESNGSTSQASICASTMSLMAAGVPIKKPVAGISCGLVTGETDDDYIVLTDIQGLEDFFGDMDFKVAGTHDGITAIQMDIKIHGLTRPIIEEAIAKTKQAREYILTEVMEKCIAGPREHVNEYAPKIVQIKIDPEKIGDVVGQRGKTINAIIDETGVKIDITDDGAVSICGTDQKMMDKAIHYIQTIVTDYKEGQIFTGKVVSIKEFGAFIEFAPGKEGMVHISKIAKERINRVEDVLTLGDEVKVICMGKDKMGRMSFSIKDVPADEK